MAVSWFLFAFIFITTITSEASDAFSFTLVKKLVPKDQNAILSPLSISACFSLAYPAAFGETAEEIKTVFGYTSPASQLKYFIELRKSFETRSLPPPTEEGGFYYSAPPPVLSLTQKLFVNVNSEWKAEYLNLVHNLVQPLNFADVSSSVYTINDYVSKSTNGLIKNVLNTIDPNTNVVAVNTLYFKARWETKFEQYNNKKDNFFISADISDETNNNNALPNQPVYMTREAAQSIGYYEDKFRQIIELKFESSPISMIFNLPKDDRAFTGGADALTQSKFHEIYPQLGKNAKDYKIKIWIPKFKIAARYEKNLIKALISMGLETSFNVNRASFPGFDNSGKKKIAIDQLIHQAVIEIDETGVEAAAVTVMAMAGMALYQPPPLIQKEFKANHPFQFYIYDGKSENILFMGQVTDPTSGEAAQARLASSYDHTSASEPTAAVETNDGMVWHVICSGILLGLFLSVLIYGFGSMYYQSQIKRQGERNEDYKLERYDVHIHGDEY